MFASSHQRLASGLLYYANDSAMNDLLILISHHGYLLLAAICLAEAIGLPLPAALALLTAGAVAAYGQLHLYFVLLTGFVAMLCGDFVLYFTGRFTGWALLGLLCRLSASPETCILRSAEYFYRRGKQTLLFAKFIPGINTMSPPLAGSMKMRPEQFLAFDAGGAALYVGAYTFAGFIFSDALRAHYPRIAFRRFCRRSDFCHRPRHLYRLSHLDLSQSIACSTWLRVFPPRIWPAAWPPPRPEAS